MADNVLQMQNPKSETQPVNHLYLAHRIWRTLSVMRYCIIACILRKARDFARPGE